MDSAACSGNTPHVAFAMRNNIQLQSVPKKLQIGHAGTVLISEAHNNNSTPQSPFLSVNSVYMYNLYRVS